MSLSFKQRAMEERLRKRLYYGKVSNASLTRASLPITDLCVGVLANINDIQLGKVDLDYAADLTSKLSISPCSMMLALVYIEQIRRRQPEYLSHVTSSDLFLVSMMVAHKFLYDEGVDDELYNDDWAIAANIDITDVNGLERDFLSAIDWKLHVRAEVFRSWMLTFENMIALSQCASRDWHSPTYTELHILTAQLPLDLYRELTSFLIKTFSLCVLVYMGSFIALCGTGSLLAAHHTSSHFYPSSSHLLPYPPLTTNQAPVVRVKSAEESTSNMSKLVPPPAHPVDCRCEMCNLDNTTNLAHNSNTSARLVQDVKQQGAKKVDHTSAKNQSPKMVETNRDRSLHSHYVNFALKNDRQIFFDGALKFDQKYCDVKSGGKYKSLPPLYFVDNLMIEKVSGATASFTA